MNEQPSRRGASIIDREPPNAAARSSARLMTWLYAVSGAGVSVRGLPNAPQRRMIDPHKPALWRMPRDSLAPGARADRSRPPRGLYPRDRRFFGSRETLARRAVTGMSDAALAEALAGELGVFGGPAGRLL